MSAGSNPAQGSPVFCVFFQNHWLLWVYAFALYHPSCSCMDVHISRGCQGWAGYSSWAAGCRVSLLSLSSPSHPTAPSLMRLQQTHTHLTSHYHTHTHTHTSHYHTHTHTHTSLSHTHSVHYKVMCRYIHVIGTAGRL